MEAFFVSLRSKPPGQNRWRRSIAMMEDFIQKHHQLWNEDIVRVAALLLKK